MDYRSDAEWELIWKWTDLSDQDLAKRVGFLQSLPKSGLSLDGDERSLLQELQALQATRAKHPRVSNEARNEPAVANLNNMQPSKPTPFSQVLHKVAKKTAQRIEDDPSFDPENQDGPPEQCWGCSAYRKEGEQGQNQKVDFDPGNPEHGPDPDIGEAWYCDKCCDHHKTTGEWPEYDPRERDGQAQSHNPFSNPYKGPKAPADSKPEQVEAPEEDKSNITPIDFKGEDLHELSYHDGYIVNNDRGTSFGDNFDPDHEYSAVFGPDTIELCKGGHVEHSYGYPKPDNESPEEGREDEKDPEGHYLNGVYWAYWASMDDYLEFIVGGKVEWTLSLHELGEYIPDDKPMQKQAQKDDRKRGDRPEQDQVVVDGSQTPDAEHKLKLFVEADPEGSKRSPLYWAMEIAKCILSYKGGDPQAAYDNIIMKAKETGLTKGEQAQVDQLLLRWQVPVAIKGEAAAAKENYVNIDGAKDMHDLTQYSQKQVAASVRFPGVQIAEKLQRKQEAMATSQAFLRDAEGYFGNRKAIRRKVLSQLIDSRITTLIKQFSREEIARDMQKWNFPQELKQAALKRLLPPPTEVKLSGPRIALSNGITSERSKRKAEAEGHIAIAADQTHLTREQRLRLSALKGKFPVETPFWIHRGQWTKPAPLADPTTLAEILTERGYKITGQDESGVQLASADGSHTVRISGSTISFTSTTDPNVEFSFGANPRDLRGFMDRLPSFKARVQPAAPAEGGGEAAAPAEKAESSLSIIKRLMGEGKTDREILDALCEIFPHRKRQNIRGVIWLARNKHAKADDGTPREATVYARLKDGRVLQATINVKGEAQIKTGFDPELKKATRKWDSPQAGWVAYMEKKGQMQDQFGPPKPGPAFKVACEQWDHREANPNNNEYPRGSQWKRIEKLRELLPHEESNGLNDGYYAVFTSEPVSYEEAEKLLWLNEDCEQPPDANGIYTFPSKEEALTAAEACLA